MGDSRQHTTDLHAQHSSRKTSLQFLSLRIDRTCVIDARRESERCHPGPLPLNSLSITHAGPTISTSEAQLGALDTSERRGRLLSKSAFGSGRKGYRFAVNNEDVSIPTSVGVPCR
jgi:hypothetical protein